MIANRLSALASLLLGILLLSFALTVHLPMLMGGAQNAMPNLLKETALAGAAFFVYATTRKEGKGLFAM